MSYGNDEIEAPSMEYDRTRRVTRIADSIGKSTQTNFLESIRDRLSEIMSIMATNEEHFCAIADRVFGAQPRPENGSTNREEVFSEFSEIDSQLMRLHDIAMQIAAQTERFRRL